MTKRKLFFSNESQWTITADPIITLQPCYYPLPHHLGRWQTFKLLVFFLPQFAKISSGPIQKCFIQCDLRMLWPIAVRATGRMAASYVTRFVARNPEMPGPAGT
jgi:hypothetical protein